MRRPDYISPTALNQFYSDRQAFYLQRMTDVPSPRPPQTKPMSIGSSFDAFIKAFLVKELFDQKMPEFELRTLFETQVEEHNRDWAWKHGAYVFACYEQTGAITDLLLELEKAIEEPRFEFTIQGTIPHLSLAEGIPVLGKPDVMFKTEHNWVIYDWKVNGYCANSAVSPKKGYIRCRETDGSFKAHKNCQLGIVDGICVNTNVHLEDVDIGWAAQLGLYGWTLGIPIGSEFVTGIDQIVAKPIGGDYPSLRVASYRCTISTIFQQELLDRLAKAWSIIHSEHIFDDMSLDESIQRCLALDNVHKAYEGDTKTDKFFRSMNQHRGY